MYNYQKEKHRIFTEEGQEMFLKIRDKAHRLIEQSGAVTMQKVISGISGVSWVQMACVDRLVELKELKEITGENTSGQNRVFVLPY